MLLWITESWLYRIERQCHGFPERSAEEMKKRWRDSGLKGWLYLLPAILFLGVFMVYPLVDVFVYSFEEDTILHPRRISGSALTIIPMCCMILISCRQSGIRFCW